MINLTSRQQSILKQLSLGNKSVTGSELAGVLGVSVRTIQNDIADLREKGFVESDKKGYSLSDLQPHAIQGIEHNPNHFDDVERIIYTLLIQNDCCGLDDLSEKLFMSKATLRRRLDEVDAYIKEGGLHIEILNNNVTVVGSEVQK